MKPNKEMNTLLRKALGQTVEEMEEEEGEPVDMNALLRAGLGIAVPIKDAGKK
jgi:hypothetical protein